MPEKCIEFMSSLYINTNKTLIRFVLFSEKTFSNKDTGDVYPKEAVHKIIEILSKCVKH